MARQDGGVTTDRSRPDLDDRTVEGLGKLSEALETVEQARGFLYGFHQLSGRADLLLQDAVDLLRDAGHSALADDVERDLVGAYLARKAATVLGYIDAEVARLDGDPRAALLSVVDAVERDVTRVGFRGCPFTNVSSEYDDPAHPARSAAADYKFELHLRLERLTDQLLPGRGEDLAAQIHLIIDGMYLSGGLLGPDGPAAHGRKLAERLIDAALAASS